MTSSSTLRSLSWTAWFAMFIWDVILSGLSIILSLFPHHLKQRLCLDNQNTDQGNDGNGKSGESGDSADWTWIHTPSLGEAKALGLWLESLDQTQLRLSKIVFTCTRDLAVEYIQDHILPGLADGISAECRLAPLDCSLVLKRFTQRYQVRHYIVYESDLWPITLQRMQRQGAQLTWMNARWSHQSSTPSLWTRLYHSLLQVLLQSAEIVARSESDALRIGQSLNLNVQLGFDSKLIPLIQLNENIFDIDDSRGSLGDKNLFAFVSIHQSELEALIPILKQVALRNSILIFPRHLSEVSKFVQILQKMGFDPQLESNLDSDFRSSMMIVDSMGKVSHYLKQCDGAYVGGGLRTPGELHNIFEPLFEGVPTYFAGERLPWEDEIDTLQGLGLVQDCSAVFSWVNQSDFRNLWLKRVTQYRSLQVKRLESAKILWNQTMEQG